MAKSTNVADPRRVADIAEAVSQIAREISGDQQTWFEAEDAKQAATKSIATTRMDVALRIAAMSTADNWTASEVEEGCNQATKQVSNNPTDRTAKTIGVFISELKTFASPKVRDEVPTIHKMCKQAWDDEGEMLVGLEKSEQAAADAPVRKYKSRFYHLVIEVTRRVKDGKVEIVTCEDVVAWARENDPDHDPKKIAARLASVIETLDGIFSDFGMTAVNNAAEYLRTIKAEELLEARKQMLAREAGLQAGACAPATSPAPLPSIPVQPRPVPAVTHASSGIEVLPGAITLDAIDLLMNDVPSHAMAA